jgi:hypothetical protein
MRSMSVAISYAGRRVRNAAPTWSASRRFCPPTNSVV